MSKGLRTGVALAAVAALWAPAAARALVVADYDDAMGSLRRSGSLDRNCSVLVRGPGGSGSLRFN